MNNLWKTSNLTCLLRNKKTITIQCKNKNNNNLKNKKKDSIRCSTKLIRMINIIKIKRKETLKNNLIILINIKEIKIDRVVMHLNLKEFIRQKVFVNDLYEY